MSSETQVAEQPIQSTTSPSEQPATELNNTPTIQDQIANWKDSLPEDLKSEKALESINDISGLAKSYIHAQKMIGSDKIPVPNKHATDEDWQAVYNKLGRPESPEKYEFNLGETTVDKDALDAFKKAAHHNGLLPKQAEGIIKFYDEMTNNMLTDLNSKAEQGRMNAEQELKKEWGAAFNQKLQSVQAASQKYLDSDFAHLTLSDGTKVGDHPAFVKAFAAIANDLGEDQVISGNGPQYLTPAEIDKQVRELQAPGSAYWQKNHPNHAAAVQEVQDLLAMKLNSQ